MVEMVVHACVYTRWASVGVSSPKRCDNGAPFLGVTTLEAELLVVVTACPVPEPWHVIRRGEPVLLISTPVLIPALDVRDSGHICG